MRIIYIIVIILLNITDVSFAQSTAVSSFNQAKQLYQQAAYEEALQLSLTIFNKSKQSAEKANVAKLIGDIYLAQGKLNQAQQYYQTGLNEYQVVETEQDTFSLQLLNNLAQITYRRGDYQGAKEQHTKLLEQRIKLLGDQHPDVADSYNNLANTNMATGDFRSAIDLHKKALEIRKQLNPLDEKDLAASYLNLGNCYLYTGNIDEARTAHAESLTLRKKIYPAQHPKLASAYQAIGNTEMAALNWSTANEWIVQAYEIRTAVLGEEHPLTTSSLERLGDIAKQLNNYNQADSLFRLVVLQRKKAMSKKHPALASLYHKLGEVQTLRGNDDRAIGYHQDATGLLTQAFGKNNARLFDSYIYLGKALSKKGRVEEALAYLEPAYENLEAQRQNNWLSTDQQKKYLQLAAILIRSSTEVVDPELLLKNAISVAEDYRSWQMEHAQTLSSVVAAIYDEGLLYYYQQYQSDQKRFFLEKAFELSEKKKAGLLLSAIQKSQATTFANIPDSLIQKEQSLNKKISQLQQQQFNPANASVKEELFALKNQRQQFIQQLEKNYPDYFKLKYNTETVSFKKIKINCKKNQSTIVSYHLANDSVFAFVITPDKEDFLNLGKQNKLFAQILSLRSNIENYTTINESDVENANLQFTQTAHDLYQQLIRPLKNKYTLTTRLTIIPDGPLGYLAFELLLGNKPIQANLFKQHDYLLREHAISYAYTANILFTLQNRPRANGLKSLLALAPTFKDNMYGLANLYHNKAEVEEVSKLFGGDRLMDAEATKANFIKAAPDYRMLLLATHANANPRAGDFSWLAFTEQKDTVDNELLYARELYNLNLPADLVVLSACETGVGEYRRNEGLMTLTRGFFYAGAGSLVNTLWSVDDDKNSQLIRQFFHWLKSGTEKDIALQKAKLDFLEDYPHAEVHPAYWAAPIATGDMAAVSLNDGWTGWSYLKFGGLVVLMLVMIRLVFRRKGTK